MSNKNDGVNVSRRVFLTGAGALGAASYLGLTGAVHKAEAAGFSLAQEDKEGPLHTYLTYSDDPSTTIDVNLCIKEKSSHVTVYFDTVPRKGDRDAYAQKLDAVYYQTPLEIYDRRAMYMAGLKGLKPGTTYYFVAGERENGFTEERSFRTLPGGTAPLRFVDGGDMNIGPRARKLQMWAGQQDPDFAVIGGDIPYSNGLLAEYDDWIQWFKNWDQFMRCSDGRMIPIVTAVGNHEVNRYESEELQWRSPDYLSLFGRQAANPYFSVRFSDDMVLFILDSDHLVPHDGAQLAWLEQEMEKYKNMKYKFACYHVPLYPTHRPFETPASKAGRTHWGPIFDKYGLTVGLEHHDHVFKRSKPLKNEQVVEKGQGTVYVGDGTFGVDPREVDPQPRWYNEKEGSIAHFWVIDVRPEGLALKAIDEAGVTVDEFTLP